MAMVFYNSSDGGRSNSSGDEQNEGTNFPLIVHKFLMTYQTLIVLVKI